MENGTAAPTVPLPTEAQNGMPAEPATTKIPKEEKAPPDVSVGSVPKQKTSKGKKRKRPKDIAAPRQPLTGYVRFLKDRRDAVRAANPSLPFPEITKLLALEWSALPVEKKQQYLDAAEEDRERYALEYNAYKQTDAYQQYALQLQNQKKKIKMKETTPKEEPKPLPVVPPPAKEPPTNNNSNSNNTVIDYPTNFDIPIFTEEFLEHNKTRDTELRQLRKSNTDYEQQNALLQKHIENMKTGIEKLEGEIGMQKKNNNAMQTHLDLLRTTLVDGFTGTKLPGVSEVPTSSTIDGFMVNLHTKLLDNNSQDANLLATVRDIVGRLEFKG